MEYNANFLWGHDDNSIESLGYEFANAKTEEYQKECWEALKEALKTSCNPVLSAVRPAVSWFGTRMEAKLALNDHEPNWNTQEQYYLLERLKQEAEELRNAYRDYASLPDDVPNNKAREKAIDECTDVANFAMMIADNLLEDGKHGR